MAAIQRGGEGYPALQDNGDFPRGNSLWALYEKAVGVVCDRPAEIKNQLDKLAVLKKNHKLSFMQLCEKSDPSGNQLKWRAEPVAPRATTVAVHAHPKFGERVYVCGFPTDERCDCKPGACAVDKGKRYRLGLGRFDCVGGGFDDAEHCECKGSGDALEVPVSMSRWLNHSQMMLQTGLLPPPSLVAPCNVAGFDFRSNPVPYPFLLLQPCTDEEAALLATPPKRGRGRPRKMNAAEDEGDDPDRPDTDGDDDEYTEHDDDDDDVAQSDSDDDVAPPLPKKSKPQPKTKPQPKKTQTVPTQTVPTQTVPTQRSTRATRATAQTDPDP